MAEVDHQAEASALLAQAEELDWVERERSDRLVAAATAYALLAIVDAIRSLAR